MRLTLACALAALAACSRGPGPIHVVSVRVAEGAITPALREAGIEAAPLADAASAALRGAGFVLGEGSRPYRAEVSIASVRLTAPSASGGPPELEVSVELELSPAQPGEGGSVRETGTGRVPLAGSDPAAVSRGAVVQAARRAAEALQLSFVEERKPLEKLIADLASKDARVREHAVRVLGDRRAAGAVTALVARLRDEDPRVVHRTVGALAQIGDPRAVGPLIEVSRGGDGSLTARVARIIGDLGGAEAEGYLLTLEAGHADPRVRAAARAALADMKAHAEQGGALSARK